MYKAYCNLKKLNKAFGKLSPYELRESVDKYISKRQKAVSDSTISRELSDLKAALSWAHNPRGGALLDNPPDKVWFNVKSGVRRTIATNENLRAIAEALPEYPKFLSDAFYISIASAQRVAAVLDLSVDRVQWDINHIDFKNPNLKGKRKGRSTTLIPEELKPLLKKCCEESQSGLVIERNSLAVSKPVLHHEWIKLRKKINLEFLWWHDLRRTWATMAARERVDMIQISRQLGHASMRITEEHYAHYHPDYMGQASDHSSRMLQNFLER